MDIIEEQLKDSLAKFPMNEQLQVYSYINKMDEFVDVIGSAGLRSSQLANLLVNVWKRFFGTQILLHFLVDADVKAEHFVILLQGQLGFGIWSNVRAVIDSETFHTTLGRNSVVPFDGTVAVQNKRSCHIRIKGNGCTKL